MIERDVYSFLWRTERSSHEKQSNAVLAFYWTQDSILYIWWQQYIKIGLYQHRQLHHKTCTVQTKMNIIMLLKSVVSDKKQGAAILLW
jgi:hypothetical protein